MDIDLIVFDLVSVEELLLYNTVVATLEDDIYITRAELRTDPYNIPAQEVDEKYLTILQKISRTFIDNQCKQMFVKEGSELEYIEKKVDGSGKFKQFINVPTMQRLIAIEKVRIYSSATSYIDYVADNFTVKPLFLEWNIYSTARGNTRRAFQTDIFERGVKNIGIFGIWGWEEIPEEIKFVQGRLISKFLKEGAFAQKYESEEAGDYNYVIKKIKHEIFGDPEIDMIIKTYTAWSVYAF